MGSSNAKKLRMKIANEIVDEYFTIQTAINNLPTLIDDINYKHLKKMNIDKLKRIRKSIHSINHELKRIDINCNQIDVLHLHHKNRIEVEIDNKNILVSKVPIV